MYMLRDFKQTLTHEELFVIMIILRDTQVHTFETEEDAAVAHKVYCRLRDYFNAEDSEHNNPY